MMFPCHQFRQIPESWVKPYCNSFTPAELCTSAFSPRPVRLFAWLLAVGRCIDLSRCGFLCPFRHPAVLPSKILSSSGHILSPVCSMSTSFQVCVTNVFLYGLTAQGALDEK